MLKVIATTFILGISTFGTALASGCCCDDDCKDCASCPCANCCCKKQDE